MKKQLKRVIALLLGAGMLIALAGCGVVATKDSDNEYEYDPAGKAELSGDFELQIFVGGYGSKAWEEIIADFEEEYPDLNVVAYMDSNVNKQMQSRWIQGNPPDFVFLDGSNIPVMTYMEEGKLLDLTSFFEKATVYGTDELLKDHIKSDLVSHYENKVLRLPLLLSSMGMWYDTVYMDELGMLVPTNYDELMAFGAAAKAKGVDTVIYPGTSSHYLLRALIFPALAVYGQEYYDRITSASDVEAFQDERFLDVLTRFEAFAEAGYFSEGTVSLNHTQSQLQWLNHKAVFIPNGLWLENEMKNDIPDGFKMRYTPSMLIKADQKPVVVTSASNMGVAADGDNKEAALEFLRFLYREENMVKFAEMANVPVATDADLSGTDLSEAAQYVQNLLSDPDMTMVNEDLLWGSVDSTVTDCVNRIVLGDMSAKEAVDAIVEAVEKKLQGM